MGVHFRDITRLFFIQVSSFVYLAVAIRFRNVEKCESKQKEELRTLGTDRITEVIDFTDHPTTFCCNKPSQVHNMFCTFPSEVSDRAPIRFWSVILNRIVKLYLFVRNVLRK